MRIISMCLFSFLAPLQGLSLLSLVCSLLKHFRRHLHRYTWVWKVIEYIQVYLQWRRQRRPGLDPWVWKSPGGGNGNPLQYSCLKNPWTEKPGGLQSMESQTVRHDWATKPTQYYPSSISSSINGMYLYVIFIQHGC